MANSSHFDADVERALSELRLVSQKPMDEKQRRKPKRDALNVIDQKCSTLIPEDSNFDRFHQNLKETLGIKNEEPFLRDKPFYTSPKDLVVLFEGNVTQDTVRKLFENQYKIKWHTITGDPDQFSFYEFCKNVKDCRGNLEGNTVMTYDTRRAHVISRLYKAQEKLLEDEFQNLTYRQLCPPVYVRTKIKGTWKWKKWMCKSQSPVFQEVEVTQNINWITYEPLRNYIESHSLQDQTNARNFPNQKKHLYWAVLEEDDLGEGRGDTGKTQIYVGKAKNGIKERWVGSQTSSHCKNMEASRNIVRNMVTFVPDVLKDKQLVDLRFLLHLACNKKGNNSGLFIMKCFEDEEELKNKETKHINGELEGDFSINPKDMMYGMNG